MTFTQRDTAEVDSVYFFYKTDSIEVSGTDSIFYFNRFINYLGDPDCTWKNGNVTLMGEKMIQRNDANRTCVFFNAGGDSIFVRTKITLGEEWHMYTWPDGSYVKGYTLNKLYAGILDGIFDTIYRIKLNVYTAGGTPLYDVFPNETKMDISQNYGIIEFFPFNDFPYNKTSLLLRGITDPDTNIVDINAHQAFDFKNGYEFHYREETAPDIASGGDKKISAWKYFVMAKSETPTSVTYTMERVKFDTIYFGAAPTSTVLWDTIDVTYNYSDYAFLDTIEFKPFFALHAGYSDWEMNDSTYNGIAYKTVYDWYNYDATGDCLNNPDNLSMPEQIYGNGLGTIHFLDSADAANYYKLDMVYFHVGLLEWGTPYDLSVLDNAIHTLNYSALSIYPVPAADAIKIGNLPESGLFGQAEIYSIDGDWIRSEKINESSINISDLSPGVYILKIQSDAGLYTGRFIKM